MTDINYTPEMVATIEAAQPLDLAKAKALGRNLIAATARSLPKPSAKDSNIFLSRLRPRKKRLHLKPIWSRQSARLLILIRLMALKRPPDRL